jgi:O-antigen ligase
LWEIDELTRRSTFINHNQNALAHLISIGVSFILYFYFTIQSKIKKRNLLFLVGLLVLPLLSTVSRTGITILLITIFIYIYFTKDVKNKVAIIFISLFILLSGTLVISFLADKIPYVQQFLDRTNEAEEDDRIKLWAIGGKLAKENLFTGVGFNEFYSEDWRQSVGLVRNDTDEYSGRTIVSSLSIHNSFLDLILIGGIFLASIYISILLNLLFIGYKLFNIPNIESKASGAFILSTTIGIILYSYTGQAATYKYTWYLLAINYYLFYKNTKIRQQ